MGVFREWDPLVGRTMSQPRCGIDAFGSVFVLRSIPKFPALGSSCVASLSSHPIWAPIKSIRVIQQEEDGASSRNVFSPPTGAGYKHKRQHYKSGRARK
jgi:hypothetical protein